MGLRPWDAVAVSALSLVTVGLLAGSLFASVSSLVIVAAWALSVFAWLVALRRRGC